MRNLAFSLLAIGDGLDMDEDVRSATSTSQDVLDTLAVGATTIDGRLLSDPLAPGGPPITVEADAPTPAAPTNPENLGPSIEDLTPADDAPPTTDIPTTPDPTPLQKPVFAVELNDPHTISASQILIDRPDVLRAYYKEYYTHDEGHAQGWAAKIGGTTAEAFASYWYKQTGKYEGYAQGATTAQDNVDLQKILTDRPDVLKAYYTEFYGKNEGRHTGGWVDKIGGDTPEAYAKHWYEHHGIWEGYAQSEKQAAENVDVERILVDRPDVMRAFYEQYFGPNNDRHSSAWADRVGGETVQDYAKYWYAHYGKAEGYTQAPRAASAPPTDGGAPADGGGGAMPSQPSDPAEGATTTPPDTPVVDPSVDPWNHPAIYPDWKPPYEGWTPPDTHAATDAMLGVGKTLGGSDMFG